MSSQGLEILEEEFHPEPSNIHMLEQFAPPPPKAPPAPKPEPTLQQLQQLQAAQRTIQALASVLTARLALMLVVIGALVLACLNVAYPSTHALIALGIFSLLIAPLAWLSHGRVT